MVSIARFPLQPNTFGAKKSTYNHKGIITGMVGNGLIIQHFGIHMEDKTDDKCSTD